MTLLRIILIRENSVWKPIYVTASDTENTSEKCPCKTFICEVEIDDEAGTITFTIFERFNGKSTQTIIKETKQEDGVYPAGDDCIKELQTIQLSDDVLIVIIVKVDAAGNESKVLEVLAKVCDTTDEVLQKIKELLKEKGISENNLQKVLCLDVCLIKEDAAKTN
ncbi:Odorant-binding protein [Camelus dromedarius]|uniref:Odorant-binding protein n=1 Tax=Camelus dromedarius TaxID=9838 RepID=A0A5N4C3V1_CAMDR|nr:Odorant-binding protein [Camelus dromedarius]